MRIRVAVALLLCSGMAWANSRHSNAKAPDLFETFRLLDEQFTQLDTQFQELQDSVAAGAAHARAKRQWRAHARALRPTTAHIEAESSRMYTHYRRVGRRWGYQNFALLRRDAKQLNAMMVRIAAAKSQGVAHRETRRAKLAMIDLLLQYQAISGGYAAARCDAGTWICGGPKPEPRRIGYPRSSVKWTCASRANACRGILGPRAPQLTPETLTVSKK
ncbi:MAG: hypothetical protein ACXVZV_03860 [Terriglobales bacterium]